jgi:hypothetical protein
MLLLAKAALGMSTLVAAAGVYLFREGVIRVDIDEHRSDSGSHIHFWVPAAVVSTGMHFLPRRQMRHTAEQVRPYLPVLREVLKQLRKYPDAEFVDVTSGTDHMRVAMSGGKLRIDAVSQDGDVVHLSVPPEVLSDLAYQLESQTPGV